MTALQIVSIVLGSLLLLVGVYIIFRYYKCPCSPHILNDRKDGKDDDSNSNEETPGENHADNETSSLSSALKYPKKKNDT